MSNLGSGVECNERNIHDNMKYTEIYLFYVIEKNKEIVLFELRDFCSIGCGLLMEFFLEKIGENWTRSRVKSTTSLH